MLEERDAETFDDSEFYQQLLKVFLDGSAIGSGAGALAASAGVSTQLRPLISPNTCPRVAWAGVDVLDWGFAGLRVGTRQVSDSAQHADSMPFLSLWTCLT